MAKPFVCIEGSNRILTIMSNKTDIERYLISVKNHKDRFQSIEQKLDIFYSDYKNKRKILKLVDVWLYFITALHEAYGVDGLKAFLLSEFNCSNRFSTDNCYLYFLAWNISFKY